MNEFEAGNAHKLTEHLAYEMLGKRGRPLWLAGSSLVCGGKDLSLVGGRFEGDLRQGSPSHTPGTGRTSG
jgi:hypothetical protein